MFLYGTSITPENIYTQNGNILYNFFQKQNQLIEVQQLRYSINQKLLKVRKNVRYLNESLRRIDKNENPKLYLKTAEDEIDVSCFKYKLEIKSFIQFFPKSLPVTKLLSGNLILDVARKVSQIYIQILLNFGY